MPQELIDAFSSRDAEIEQLLEKKIEEYETSTGKQVGWRMKAELHKEAWLATRKAKPEIQPSLKAKRDHWYQKLGEVAPASRLTGCSRTSTHARPASCMWTRNARTT